MPAATLSIVSPRTNVKNSSKSLIFFIFFSFRVAAKQVGVGPAEKDRGPPPVGGGAPARFGGRYDASTCRALLGDRNPESGGVEFVPVRPVFWPEWHGPKRAREGGSLPWQKNPPTAESKESDGEQREGDVCQGNGLDRVRSASSVEFERMQEPNQMRMPQGRAEWGLGAYETSR